MQMWLDYESLSDELVKKNIRSIKKSEVSGMKRLLILV
jgi:hypothetical protein